MRWNETQIKKAVDVESKGWLDINCCLEDFQMLENICLRRAIDAKKGIDDQDKPYFVMKWVKNAQKKPGLSIK